jgi:hypothetical protein
MLWAKMSSRYIDDDDDVISLREGEAGSESLLKARQRDDRRLELMVILIVHDSSIDLVRIKST